MGHPLSPLFHLFLLSPPLYSLRMKKTLSLFALCLLLTACGSKTVRYRLAFDTADMLRRSELTAAAARVIEGRVVARGKQLLSHETKTDGENVTIIAEVSDAEAATALQDGLLTPFTMTIMKQVEKGMGDIVSEKFGEFKETGITTKHFDWVSAGTAGAEAEVNGAVIIQFTPEGQELLKKIFKENRGSVIGIFVRGQLMSKKLIDSKDTQGSIAIDGIPNPALAGAFADDVNVGLHVTFIPIQ